MKTSDMAVGDLLDLHDHHVDLIRCVAGMLLDWSDVGDPARPRERLIDRDGLQPIFAELWRLSDELAEVGTALHQQVPSHLK